MSSCYCIQNAFEESGQSCVLVLHTLSIFCNCAIRRDKNAKVLYAGVGLGNPDTEGDPLYVDEPYLLQFEGKMKESGN